MVGGRNDKATNQRDYWVARFDKSANLLWDSTYGTNADDFLWSIEPTREGGALIAGFSGMQFSGLESALIYRIDANGRTQKEFNLDYDRADHAHWIFELPDGGYLWGGHTDSDLDTNGDMIVGRLNANFGKVWEKSYDLGSPEHSHAAALTSDGGAVLVGHAQEGFSTVIWAIRIDSVGGQIWSKTYPGVGFGSDPYSIRATREGGFVIAGYTQESNQEISARMLVIDSAGKVIFSKHYNRGVSVGSEAIQTKDGGFIMAGAADQGTNTQLYVVKTDDTGKVEWERSIGGSATEEGFGVIEWQGKYLIAGYVQTEAEGQDLWVLPLDLDGTPTTFETAAVKSARNADSFFIPSIVARDQFFPVQYEVGASDVSIRISSIDGRQVSDNHFYESGSIVIQRVKAPAVAGVYLVQIQTSAGIATGKLLVK